LEIKTDHEDYYNHICNTLANESGFTIIKKETVYEAINSNPTKFEKIFLQKGQPIFWIFLQKKG
jgi:tRNA G46 methylase TrmB